MISSTPSATLLFWRRLWLKHVVQFWLFGSAALLTFGFLLCYTTWLSYTYGSVLNRVFSIVCRPGSVRSFSEIHFRWDFFLYAVHFYEEILLWSVSELLAAFFSFLCVCEWIQFLGFSCRIQHRFERETWLLQSTQSVGTPQHFMHTLELHVLGCEWWCCLSLVFSKMFHIN